VLDIDGDLGFDLLGLIKERANVGSGGGVGRAFATKLGDNPVQGIRRPFGDTPSPDATNDHGEMFIVPDIW